MNAVDANIGGVNLSPNIVRTYERELLLWLKAPYSIYLNKVTPPIIGEMIYLMIELLRSRYLNGVTALPVR